MAKHLTLGIDSGTSSCKVLALAADGTVAGHASAPHEIRYPAPGHAEQDPQDWWTAARAAIAELDAGIRERVRAVAVSSQREGFVLVDGKGQPLAPCMIWLDRRAEEGAARLLASIGEAELFAITGLRADPAFSLPRILWLQEAMPEMLERAQALLQPADYLLYRLTGRFVSDVSMACRTCLLDVVDRRWSEALIDRFGVSRRLLPELVEPGDRLGPVLPAAAAELGLPEGVEVVAGGGDQQAMAVGSGAAVPGVLAASVGTSTSVVAITTQAVFDHEQRVLTGCAALPGAWDLQAPVWTTGGAVEWLARIGGRTAEEIAAGALGSEPGAREAIFVPHLIGAGAPWWVSDARGALLNISPGHRLEDLARALLEAIGMEIRANVEIIGELTEKPRTLVLSGGLVADPRVAALLAAVVGMPVRSSKNRSLAALGVAALAGRAIGFADRVEVLLPDAGDPLLEPDSGLAAVYDELFAGRQAHIVGALDRLSEATRTRAMELSAIDATAHAR